ncbi:Mov34/MPN/PAD-1 family protein [Aeromonas caviae]|uniref:Mov34/MPN/PAD-1 family protein n=1 Tax=Aeromonas caviae TaxID=648 RepID=UPI0038D03722
MPFVKTWAAATSGQLVHIGPQPIEVFSRHIQERGDAREAGGILLGHVRGPHLEIIKASEPTFRDRRFRFLFERQVYHHDSFAKRCWLESGGTIRYIGEWHTHPEDYPIPSLLDTAEWKALAANRSDGRALMALIVGCRDLHLEYMHADGERLFLRHATEAECR